MIPAPFDYHRPDTVEAAVKLMADLGDSARVIAGGHSLIPLMKMRMTDIAHLVDLQKIGALKGIAIDGDTVTIGAMTTQQELIGNAALAGAAPIIREAALQIADPQVRYVGTIGGNVANGDPGNDMPGLMQCLDATYHLQGPDGAREIKARDFYEAAYFTARADDEILTAISFQAPAGGQAYVKQKRKTGDYATAAASVIIAKSDGNCSAASIAMTNLSDTPVWCEAAGQALAGSPLGEADVENAVRAMLAVINPQDDNKGPAEFKRHTAAVILRRAIERAASRA
ncbi:carbon monoxide dehydrogenase medium subunit [Rhizobium subbaraonis]|uniref:Carbon monoxide dehydrogenase medium subunit n=1 Tax=Rhizobium subbaraonis TaxID=908946 RepID=A0A285U5C5_9HYPH|nr:xanthine dehydrogenase family protein subunit M [Rhizobium subbaraonis]SOC35726.1 carbon monoxide dehydrogenase medium subunit [Rhizobium subbaraonis]